MFLAAYREFWRYIDWLCEHFFLIKIPIILKNSSLIGFFKKFQKMFNNFYPKSSFFFKQLMLFQLPYWLVVRFQDGWCPVVSIKSWAIFQRAGCFFIDPQQVVLMLTRLRAVWHVLLVSNFEFLVNLKIFWGGEVWSFDRVYAFPHNLSKKFLYGMKPSSSSLSASSSRSLTTSSLGISSPKLVRKFSSSANIMVPFSFLS